FKKIYKPTNNNLRTSSNTSRANQDNSQRIHRNAGYEGQRNGTVAGARDTVVDACPNACEMWKAIERLKQGDSINVQDLETNLFWEFRKFTSLDGESLESYYSRFYKLMNELTKNKCTVTNHQVNVQFLLQLQPEWQRFVTLVKQSQELKHVSYHKLYDILKQHQHEVNEIRAEKIARVANPLALVAQQQQPHHPHTHPNHFNQNSSTRTHQSATRKKEKAVFNSPQPIYDQEPSMVDDDDEDTSKEKEIDKLMALISLSFKKIYKLTNNNLRTSSNTTRANQDNSPRIHRNAGYEGQRNGTVAGVRDTVGSSMVQKSGIQCYNCKEYGHIARECQKPKRAKDAAYHREKMLLYAQNVLIESEDMNYDDDQIEQNEEDVDLAKERELLASLIAKLKYFKTKNKSLTEANNKLYEVNAHLYADYKKSKDELKCRNTVEYATEMELECAKLRDFKNKNKSLTEANNKLSEVNDQLYADYKKSKAELQRRNSIEYASEIELECAKVRAGSKDRPPMLAPGNYIQWKSRIKRYIDTKPNREHIHYCLENPPYELGWKDKFINDADGNPTTATHQVFETLQNVEQVIRDRLNAKVEAVQIILTGIDNDIYSTVDACPNSYEMWKAIERLKQGESINVQDLETSLFWEFGKFTSLDGESSESYYS
nr:hypothetical protein [Tanacetum cinerariifolium]